MKCKDILSNNNRTVSVTRYFTFLLIFLVSSKITSQIKLDFDDKNLQVVKWEGNIQHFTINTTGQLQLQAPIAGQSSIFTKFKIPKDSIQIDLYFKLQFAPSSDNFAKIYLFTDNSNETVANGYYLKLGENGSSDAIQVYKLENGISTLVGSGTMGAISADPADARVSIKIYRDGLWVMSTDYTGNRVYEEDLMFADPTFALNDSMYFGIFCKYTSTRTDKFFFDDINIQTVSKDTSAPELFSTEVIDETKVKLVFSESVESLSAMDTKNYVVDNGLGSPSFVNFSSSNPLEVILNFNNPVIKSGINYTLTVSGIKDKSGNSKSQFTTFVFASKPQKGDLIISEILTNPYIGGEDFVEIYNVSDKYIKLDSLLIRNAQKNETKVIRTNQTLLSKSYIAISKNVDFLKTTYATPDSALFIEAILPSLNVDGANISIISNINGQNIVIDSFDYNEKMHFELIDDTKGVSLERINNIGKTNDLNNWHSAASLTKFATPGYKNSNTLSLEPIANEAIVPDKKIITPDGDGSDDFVLLQYKLDKPGYLATIKIFDAEGFPVSDLANNLLLGTEGSIKWDGLDEDGNVVKMGMYILYSRLSNIEGKILESKNVVVVAQKF